MAKQLSTAAANFLAGDGSWGDLFTNFLMMWYDGVQPTNADAAATGVACTRFSKNAGAVTMETRATAVIDFSSTTGNLTALTAGGTDILAGAALVYSSPSQMASDLALRINLTRTFPNYTATALGNVCTLIAPKNTGTSLNGLTIAATVAAGSVAINGASADTLGVGAGGSVAGVAAVNCLTTAYPAVVGVVSKPAADVWQGISGSGAGAGYIGFVNSFTSGTKTAGWARLYMSPDDPELTGTPTLDASKVWLRYDGTIGTDIPLTGGSVLAFGATQTHNSFSMQVPVNQG